MDKTPSKYSLKSKKKTLPGPWRASRKRSGSAPGQQAAERLFMTHGQAAQRPDFNRTSECVSLRLLKEFAQARNRPRDCKGKTLPIPQSIVQAYGHIKQLFEDSRVIQEQTNIVLVTINNTTVSSWLHDRQKRTNRDSLLQGAQLPQKVSVAKDPLPQARVIPSTPVEHGHAKIQFQEPENREDEAVIRPRHSFRSGSALAQHYPLGSYEWPASSALLSSHQQEHTSPAPLPACSSYQQGHPPPAQPPVWPTYQQDHPPPAQPPVWPTYQQGHPPPVPSPGWYQQGHPPPAQPPVWPTYQQGHPPPVPSPGWYQQGHPPPAQPPVWPTYQQGHPPPVPSPGWYQQGHPPPAQPPVWPTYQQGHLPPVPSPGWYQQGHLPPATSPPFSSQSPLSSTPSDQSLVIFNRHRQWRRQKAALEDEERLARGEPPKKRQTKEHYHYQCKLCGQSKSKLTGHSQVRGKWYCPASGQTIAEWKDSL
ncbi:wiskott-Aldrich syndrome protein family member 2-like [Pimephales promelas]|uniref:wiskott-Aldrich syndrome protein family member 2-like n=1 Tax=Pimephales promelas TaxID=90988 RepID=UPI001955CFF2|nr:wiskott-Aldrich syndrome protein family member 2-like [Pimephales promelas]